MIKEEYTNEDLVEFGNSIPIDELFDEIKRVTNLPDLKFTYKIVDNGYRGVRIVFASQDLADRVGFLQLLFKELYITQFNSEIIYKKYDDEDEPKYRYWGTVAFSYEHPRGGTNGHTFMRCWYERDKGWEFEIEK